jgi:non-canonical purine NTP pyrophosphatase (RdgB/HAM1 family)
MKITLASGNKAKIRETEEILDIDLEVSEIELDEIQDLELDKVALHKINQAYSILKKPVMIDDVSFEIEAWNGFPGPLIKWMLKAGDGPALLLKLLENETNRNATAKLAIGFHDGKEPRLFIGEAKGTVALEIKGENGFGWDKVFIPEGYNETYAQMDKKLKNSISHRGLALSKFRDFLKDNYQL